MVSCFLSVGRTVFELAQGLRDSKSSNFNYSSEAILQEEALNICQDRVFTSFVCVLSLSSVLGGFIHLYCDTGLLKLPSSRFPHAQYICCKYIIENRGNPSLWGIFLRDVKVKILINSWHFFKFCLDVPSVALRLTPSVFSKWKMLSWYTYQATFLDIESSFRVLNFYTRRKCYFTLLLGQFWAINQSPRQDSGSVGAKKSFACFGKQHKSKFPGKHSWQSAILEKKGGRSCPHFTGGPGTPKNVVNFVWNFDQWWYARWCIRFATAFIEVLRNGIKY